MTGSGIFMSVLLFASAAQADILTSPNFKINGNIDGNFGGQGVSTNYKMSSIGGEAVAGNGQSGSYILRQEPMATPSTMRLSVQPSGLVGYYPLDENNGTTTADASQYQNNGTFTGTASWYAGSKLGNAVDMLGAGAVHMPDSANLPSGSAMTVEVWANQNAWLSNVAFASHWLYSGTNGASWALQTGTNNNLRVFIAASPGDFGDNYVDTAANTWNAGAWRHVVMVYDGTQAQANKVKVYVNGVAQSATAFGTLPSTLQNSSGELSIGDFPGLGRNFNGALDHVKIFNRALNASEVSAEYQAQNAGIPAGLTLGILNGNSTSSSMDAIVRTNSTAYGLSVQQDHDLQNGGDTIPAFAGSIASPVTWTEGVTNGLGFTVTNAPTLDVKWGGGNKYAAYPNASAIFYNEAAHNAANVDVVGVRLRLDVDTTQPVGAYSNSIVYTGTALP